MLTEAERLELAELITAKVTARVTEEVQEMLDVHEVTIKKLLANVSRENYQILEATRLGYGLTSKLVKKFIPMRVWEFNRENFLKIAIMAMTLAPLFDTYKKALTHINHPHLALGVAGGFYSLLWLYASFRANYVDHVQILLLIPGLFSGLLSTYLLPTDKFPPK